MHNEFHFYLEFSMKQNRRYFAWITLIIGLASFNIAMAQVCPQRGDLADEYCDANRDMVADAPRATVNPNKIVLGFSAIEDTNSAVRTYGPLMDYLRTCLKKEVEMFPPTREGAVMEAQRTGIVHIGQYATGATMMAVNFAGVVPFAAKGKDGAGRFDSYTLKLIVKSDSNFKQINDLRDKKIAHTSQTSNSGNLAPRALFPDQGLKPDLDYKVEFSGSHEKSIIGVKLGLYDGAAIASDVLSRLIAKGEVAAKDFRVVYESEPFPPDAFAMSHNLEPKLQAQIRKCFGDYKASDHVSKFLEGNNRFYPVQYRADWQIVRLIAKVSGRSPTREAYLKLTEKK
jgi:phosphonate transport system substrate-binding protein